MDSEEQEPEEINLQFNTDTPPEFKPVTEYDEKFTEAITPEEIKPEQFAIIEDSEFEPEIYPAIEQELETEPETIEIVNIAQPTFQTNPEPQNYSFNLVKGRYYNYSF